jgi:hypothetical protein
MKKIAALFIFAVLATGCMRVSTAQMAPQLQYCGFTVKRPADNRWYMNRSENEPLRACFRMDGSRTHSIYTMIDVSCMQSSSKTIDEFEQNWRAEKTQTSGRMKLLEYTSSQSLKQGQWCINYSLKSLDLNPINSATPLVMTMKGFVVLHPNVTNAVVDAYVSQRGEESELSPEIDNSGKSIVDGVRLESAQGKEL